MGPRIVTLTSNPAVDVAMDVPRLCPGRKLRATGEIYDAGGGGINVSRVVHALGGDTLAIFGKGAATGQAIRQLLSRAGVPCVGVPVSGMTRISVTVHDKASGSEFRFVPQGPCLTPRDGERLLSIVSSVRADWLVASGSLPVGLPSDFYARVAHTARKNGAKFALDTSGEALKAALYQGVDLLKVSREEFRSISSGKIGGRKMLSQAALRLAAAGAASMIAVTLGTSGSILVTRRQELFQPALKIKMQSSVGAGDSFLAGMVLALARGHTPEAALRFASAVAASAVASRGTARVDVNDVEALLNRRGA